MYALHTSDEGRVTAIDLVHGTDWSSRRVRFHVDQNDDNYQAFLKWNNASQEPVDLNNLPSGSLTCLGVEPVVAWCKHVPKVLFADRGKLATEEGFVRWVVFV